MALDYRNYKGNDDFRGFLAGNGFNNLLKYTGNDGGVDRDAMIRTNHPDGTGFNDANDLGFEYAGTSRLVRGLYNDWSANRNKDKSPTPTPSNPQGGYYNPQAAAAAEAKARADEIAKYREQERVAAEGLGRLDRQDALNNVDSQIESSRIDLNNRIMDARQKQKTANGQGLQSAIDQTRDLSNQISNSQNKILDLSKETPKALEKVEFKAPKLSDYSENVQGVKVDSGNPDQAGLQDQLDPRLAALLDPNKKKKDLQG